MKSYTEWEELERMERVATNLRDRLLISLLYHEGCRVSEALALEVGDVDFDQGTVTIKHLKTRLKLNCPHCAAQLARSHTFCPKCGRHVKETVARQEEHRKLRTLPLYKDTLYLLKEFVRRGGPVKRGGKWLIFGINRHRAWQIIKECSEKAELPRLINPETGKEHNVSPHRLRDAFAVHAVKMDDSGDGLRLLQIHLGHQSFNTTARYRKVASEEHREWYNKLWQKEDKANGPKT